MVFCKKNRLEDLDAATTSCERVWVRLLTSLDLSLSPIYKVPQMILVLLTSGVAMKII